MPHEITVPRLGWSMEEGVLGAWLKSPGDLVRVGESLFSLEGEKAAQEIESLDEGYLCVPADAPQTGDTVKVGQVIGYLLAEGEMSPTTVGKPAPRPVQTLQTAGVAATELPRSAGPAARRLARQLGIDLNVVMTPDPTGRVLCEDVQRAATQHSTSRVIATPRARRRAKELGIDWTKLTGTGRGGRIRERDLHQSDTSTEEPMPASPGNYVSASKRRAIIAQRMVAGISQAAPVTMTTKVDAGSIVNFRNRLKQSAAPGEVPSYNDILIYLAARTLRQHPQLNSCWHRNGIYQYDDVHIALAVDTELGLLAPVVRHADQSSLDEIASQTRRLIAEVRVNSLNQKDLVGGTFTITSLGTFGIDAFTPILNLPQAGILGVGRIVEEPVVRGGKVVAGQTLSLSLTFDHRVIDGAPAALWLKTLCERIVSLSG